MSITPVPVPRAVALIARAFDEVTDEYAENNKVIFQHESERARQHFATVSRWLKGWSKSHRCMVPGCSQRSISRSHTIPKGMSLRVIGENGHVLVPAFDQTRGELKLESTGLADATTFPGFCTAHELLFEEFENKGSIATEPHVYLQTYRTACRELFRAKFVLEQHDWMMAEYCSARDKGLIRLIRERARALGVQEEIDLKSLRFEQDPLVDGGNERVASVRRLVAHLEQRLLPAVERAVFHGDESGVAVTAANIDLEIPLALVGSASFFVNDNGAETEVCLLMNVVPQSGSTLIILTVLSAEERFLEAYKLRWMGHALSFLSMIESWMINGTDQWCIRPSVWKKLPTGRTARLFSDLLQSRRNIWDEYDASIFDDIRSEFIRLSNLVNANNMATEYREFIELQQKKMT